MSKQARKQAFKQTSNIKIIEKHSSLNIVISKIKKLCRLPIVHQYVIYYILIKYVFIPISVLL